MYPRCEFIMRICLDHEYLYCITVTNVPVCTVEYYHSNIVACYVPAPTKNAVFVDVAIIHP